MVGGVSVSLRRHGLFVDVREGLDFTPAIEQQRTFGGTPELQQLPPSTENGQENREKGVAADPPHSCTQMRAYGGHSA